MNINLPNKQAGVSLISLMVGMALSLMTMAALFVLFQQTTRQSIQMREDMDLDGQVSTILLSIQQDVQSAGFGIEDVAVDKIVVEADPSKDLEKWHWRYTIDGMTYCQGFEEFIEDGDPALKMRWLNEIPCNLGDELKGVTWDDDDDKELAAVFENQTESILEIVLDKASCWPYSQGDDGPHWMLTVTADNSIVVGGNPGTYSFDYCLTNITY